MVEHVDEVADRVVRGDGLVLRPRPGVADQNGQQVDGLPEDLPPRAARADEDPGAEHSDRRRSLPEGALDVLAAP